MSQNIGKRNVKESLEGRCVGYKSFNFKTKNIAFDATIRAAALNQTSKNSNLAVNITLDDLKEKILERKTGNTILFLIDSSGSMGVKRRMSTVKGSILSILLDTYQKRDKVGLVIFRDDDAELLMYPTSNFSYFKRLIDEFPTGGKTPLSKGLSLSYKVLLMDKNQNNEENQILVIITDGKANVSSSNLKPFEDLKIITEVIKESKISSVVIDSEEGLVRLGFAKKLAEMIGAKYLTLDEIRGIDIYENNIYNG